MGQVCSQTRELPKASNKKMLPRQDATDKPVKPPEKHSGFVKTPLPLPPRKTELLLSNPLYLPPAHQQNYETKTLVSTPRNLTILEFMRLPQTDPQ